jgi:membrane-bound lytic murein transglycosylase B
MIDRRFLLTTIPALIATPAFAQSAGFDAFLESVRAEARHAGISSATLQHALFGLQPDAKVLEHERHQPEFTMTWAQYRALLVTDKRIQAGRAAWQRNRPIFEQVQQTYGVPPDVILGIWGLESSFGVQTGDFRVVDALATLGWASSRPGFFRSELIAALRILDAGDVTPTRMTGSYAGAMGQPQFMPSSYLRYAVDIEGTGRPDIWTSTPDVLASIANYLLRSGWRAGETWGQPASLPAAFDPNLAGRDNRRPLSDWLRMGVRPTGGRLLAYANQRAAVVQPDGPGGEAFFAYANFAAIRRYNPSDLYALAVGLIGDGILA